MTAAATLDRLARAQIVLGAVAAVVGLLGLLYPGDELFLASDDDLPYGNLLSFATAGAVAFFVAGVATVVAALARRPALVLGMAAVWSVLGLYSLMVSDPDDNVLGIERLGGFAFSVMMAVGLSVTALLARPLSAE